MLWEKKGDLGNTLNNREFKLKRKNRTSLPVPELHCMCISQFVYPFPYWWMDGCFQFLAIKNKAAVYIFIQFF